MTAAQLADRLPAAGVVRRWSQSLAMLDAIMSPEREYRYFSFDSESGPDQSLASMDNGSGDEYSITFTGSGVFLRGFAHEAPLSPWAQDPPALWPGILAGLPAELTALAREPAFAPDDGVPAITVALWRQPGDGQWHYGRISYPPVRENQYSDFDGSDALFAQLDGRAESYLEYASWYFGRQPPADAVAAVIEHCPLTVALVNAINPGRSFHDLTDDLDRIRYPAR